MKTYKVISGSKNGKTQIVEHLNIGTEEEPRIQSRTLHINMVNAEVGHTKDKQLWVNIKTGEQCKNPE